jgi:hypothetical protein
MTTLREAAAQALEYLDRHAIIDGAEVRDALRQALEAERQEPAEFYDWWTLRPSLTRLQAYLLWREEVDAEIRQALEAVTPETGIPASAGATAITAETCKCCGEGQANLVVLRICDKCGSEYAGQAEMDLAKQVKRDPLTEWMQMVDENQRLRAELKFNTQPAQQPDIAIPISPDTRIRTTETSPLKLTADRAAVVDRTYHWIPLSVSQPARGAKVQLINRAHGVAAYGTWEPKSQWTHYAPLPTFAPEDQID